MPIFLMSSEFSTSHKYCLQESSQPREIGKQGESQSWAEVDYAYGGASHVQLAPFNWFHRYPQLIKAQKRYQQYMRTNQINFRSWRSEKFHQGEYLWL